jgi:hypothetical protein
VQCHELDGRAERVAVTVHDHRRAVADEDAIDLRGFEYARERRVVAGDHRDLSAGGFGGREVEDRFHVRSLPAAAMKAW